MPNNIKHVSSFSIIPKAIQQVTRAVAYCRVSTDHTAQLSSLANQRQHYEAYIKNHPYWEYAGIYYDEGISGTSMGRRAALQQLILDALEGKFQILITKSISRLARNTVDCLNMIRLLTQAGVRIIFEKENIDTQNIPDEFLVATLSALADNESRSLSANIKWGIQRCFERGSYIGGPTPYGYTYEYGTLTPVQHESEIVRKIFALASAGKSPYAIADELNMKGIFNHKNKPWHNNSIRYLLQNEKYTGDVLYQKYFRDDTYQVCTNIGQKCMYLVQYHHPAIIGRDIFYQLNKYSLFVTRLCNIHNIHLKYFEAPNVENEAITSSKVTIIPASKHLLTDNSTIKAKKRVAAYCRVSSDSDEQANSYDAQVEHYTAYITSNPDWTLAGIYSDEGISGTSTKNRPGFNQMIRDCMAHQIDIIITKSISRFARNTVDCLKYIRQLRAAEIEIIFEKENIHTLDVTGEMLITIMASLAQQESESLSKNVRMGLRFRYQQGKVIVNHNKFLGYERDSEDNWHIQPEQAKVVQRIYQEYLAGYTLYMIKKGLERDGILTSTGRQKWSINSLKHILTNEKYIGDALLQKTITIDVLTKRRIKNDGREVQYYIENHHPAIISREVFRQVQEERQRRVMAREAGRTHRGQFALSNIITCGICGGRMKRITWYKPHLMYVWRCHNRIKKTNTTCILKSIQEHKIQQAILAGLQQNINPAIRDYDEFTVRQTIEHITVKPNHLKIVFKNGTSCITNCR